MELCQAFTGKKCYRNDTEVQYNLNNIAAAEPLEPQVTTSSHNNGSNVYKFLRYKTDSSNIYIAFPCLLDFEHLCSTGEKIFHLPSSQNLSEP